MKRAYCPQKTFAPVVTVLIGALCKGEIKCRLQRKAERSPPAAGKVERTEKIWCFILPLSRAAQPEAGVAHRNTLKLWGQKD